MQTKDELQNAAEFELTLPLNLRRTLRGFKD